MCNVSYIVLNETDLLLVLYKIQETQTFARKTFLDKPFIVTLRLFPLQLLLFL